MPVSSSGRRRYYYRYQLLIPAVVAVARRVRRVNSVAVPAKSTVAAV